MTTPHDVRAWLDAFARCVRDRDLDGGRALFHEGARGFGTRTPVMDGLEDLVRLQWEPTWSRTRGFDVDPDSVRCYLSRDGSQAVATACWQSEGVDAPEDWGRETPYLRRGRLTIVLARDADGALRAVHSHYSLQPVAEGRSAPRRAASSDAP